MEDGVTYFFDGYFGRAEASEYVTDKKKSCSNFIDYWMLRLLKMFKYEELPDTIPKDILERYTIMNGSCYVTEVNSKLYAILGTFGGAPDEYYRPTKYIVSNPGLKCFKEFDIKNDGVLFRNDYMWKGLYPLLARYAYLMSENLLTLRTADIMLRVIAMMSAPDDKTKKAGEAYLNDIVDGKLGVIGESRFFDEGIKLQSPPSNNGSYLTQFIELHQYLKGSFYNEIGLNANFNMKREALGDGETSLNDDILMPLCDQMLSARKEDVAKINEKYGTNITVEYDSSWAYNVKELEIQLETMQKEASQLAESEASNGGRSKESCNDCIGDDDKESGNSGENHVDNVNKSADSVKHEQLDGKSTEITNDAKSDKDGRGDTGSGSVSNKSTRKPSETDDPIESDDKLDKEKKDE